MTFDRFRRDWANYGLINDEGGVLMVERGLIGWDSWCGVVGHRPRRRSPSKSVSFFRPMPEVPDMVRSPQRMLAEYFFAHTTVHRVQAGTEVDNVAEQRALEKAGFTREGVLRGGGWRDGAWRDGVMYSILRSDLR